MSSLASKQLIDKDRAAFFSLATSGSAFGTLLTGTLGSFILEHLNWEAVFYVIGVLCCSWTLLFHHLCQTSDKIYFSTEKVNVPWVLLFRKPAFWSCVLAHACQNNCFFTLLSWLPTYFHDVFPEAKGWLVNMVPWLFTVPCTFLGKWISECLLSKGFSVTSTRKTVEAICLLTQAFGLLALGELLKCIFTCWPWRKKSYKSCKLLISPNKQAMNRIINNTKKYNAKRIKYFFTGIWREKSRTSDRVTKLYSKEKAIDKYYPKCHCHKFFLFMYS